jgi:hypothetical protein
MTIEMQSLTLPPPLPDVESSNYPPTASLPCDWCGLNRLSSRTTPTAGGDAPSAGASNSRALGRLPSTVAALLDPGAAPANALTTVLAWWAVNIRWAGYRAGEVVAVIKALRAAGALVTDRDREFAADAGELAVASVLDA